MILDLPFGYCVWISSAVAIVYTLLGGLYSVAYTDVIQLALTFFSLVSVFRLLLWTEAETGLFGEILMEGTWFVSDRGPHGDVLPALLILHVSTLI